MSLTISLDNLHDDKQENKICHLLPCKINHNGNCNVTKYFDPFIRKCGSILKCSLRGHPLEGQKIKVPEGFKGIVVKDKKIVQSEDKREMEAVGTFQEFTTWNWDKTPSLDDKIVKALQWIEVTSALHKPISECEEFDCENFKTGLKRKLSDS